MEDNILVSDSLFFTEDFKNKILSINPNANVIFCDENSSDEIDFSDVNILFGLPVYISNQIKNTPNIEWCQSVFSGVDAIISAKKGGYKLTNSKGIYGKSMAEYCLGYILLHSKKAFYHANNQKNKVWDRINSDTIEGKNLLIFGAGSIGSEIASMAKKFGMKTTGIATTSKYIEGFDNVYDHKNIKKCLVEADYIVNVLPNVPSTCNFFDEEKFKLMKKSSVFISIGRGTNVDEDAIYNALLNNQIALGIMDVFKNEPLLKNSKLWNLENLIITPHISGFIQDYEGLSNIFLTNYKKYINGENLDNLVDFEKGY